MRQFEPQMEPTRTISYETRLDTTGHYKLNCRLVKVNNGPWMSVYAPCVVYLKKGDLVLTKAKHAQEHIEAVNYENPFAKVRPLKNSYDWSGQYKGAVNV